MTDTHTAYNIYSSFNNLHIEHTISRHVTNTFMGICLVLCNGNGHYYRCRTSYTITKNGIIGNIPLLISLFHQPKTAIKPITGRKFICGICATIDVYTKHNHIIW